ncbi:unnamed protein product, partial [Ectocarpus sp. 8 AP-2014]
AVSFASVTSSTIIANSSALFTYLFSVVARTERFTKTKTVGVALALLGAVMASLVAHTDTQCTQRSPV